MKLTVCTTYYHVYVTLLKRLALDWQTDLVLCDDIPTGKTLARRLEETALFSRVWFLEQSLLPEVRGRNVLDWIFFQHRRRYRTLHPLLPFRPESYDDIYLYHDGTAVGMYLNDARLSYHLVEDSLNFYQRLQNTAQARLLRPHNWKYWVRRVLNSGYFPLGESPLVRDIEVNENRDLQIMGKPIVELPRAPLEQRLTRDQRQVILDVFGYPRLPQVEGRAALVLTEPLFADGLCATPEEQLDIYVQLTRVLRAQGFQVVFKPHPRDRVDYTLLGVETVERMFPVELLHYIPAPPFSCAAAVSSSALFAVRAEEKFFWRRGMLCPADSER